jgi:cytochrome c oxidase subunit II
MKTLIKLIAVAAAFGLSPAAAVAQDLPPAQSSESITAESQADPALPQEASPDQAAVNPEEPSDATVAQSLTGSTVAPISPQPGIGQPDGRMGLQEQFTEIGEEAAWFHNVILLPVITVISIFVLALMLYVIVRYRRRANPEPSRTTHHTLIEVIWTLVPVIILVVIAVPSIRLLANQYDPPAADLTVKVTGNQWYWTYSYPDHGDFEIISNMLSDEDAEARGEPRLLAVDSRMVVPAGATVKLIVTSNDVIHAFAVPAFWSKIDAVPGRLNETWFKVDRPGVYYGQCSELCGARHVYMPIAVEVVPPAQFAAWVASKGGTMPGSTPAPATASDAVDDTSATSTPQIPDPPLVNATTAAVPVEQSATANPTEVAE